MINLPFSEACEQNKDPILAVLTKYLADTNTVFEVGSGTGQHATYFSTNLPHLIWQTSDVAEYVPGIAARVEACSNKNLLSPIALDVNDQWSLPERNYDAVYTANTVHIMSSGSVRQMFQGVAKILTESTVFLIYGPFNYQGNYTSQSNRHFDGWLKSRDPHSGIKHFEDIITLAKSNYLTLVEDIKMPVNNRILVFKKNQ